MSKRWRKGWPKRFLGVIPHRQKGENSMRKAKIGLVCLARKTFDYQTAFQLYTERMATLVKDDSVDYLPYPEEVIEDADAQKSGGLFCQRENRCFGLGLRHVPFGLVGPDFQPRFGRSFAFMGFQ
jgi:hypothetical protein